MLSGTEGEMRRVAVRPGEAVDHVPRSHFPHFMIAISRHGFGLCLEPEGGGREAHEGEDLLVEHAELGLEDLHEAVALA